VGTQPGLVRVGFCGVAQHLWLAEYLYVHEESRPNPCWRAQGRELPIAMVRPFYRGKFRTLAVHWMERKVSILPRAALLFIGKPISGSWPTNERKMAWT